MSELTPVRPLEEALADLRATLRVDVNMADVAKAMTCSELNVFVDFLAAFGERKIAQVWLDTHLEDDDHENREKHEGLRYWETDPLLLRRWRTAEASTMDLCFECEKAFAAGSKMAVLEDLQDPEQLYVVHEHCWTSRCERWREKDKEQQGGSSQGR